MAKKAGRKALIKVSGTSTSMTAEATTTSDELSYQITNAAKRVLDPTFAVTVLVDAVATEDAHSVNRLTGTVTFEDARGELEVITITGKYLPLTTAVSVKSHAFTISGENADVSEYGDTWKSRLALTKDANGTIGSWRTTTSTYWEDSLVAGNPVVLEFYSDSSGTWDYRAWALLGTHSMSAALSSVQDQTVDWVGAADADGRVISAP